VKITWFGQSAFELAAESGRVFIDPFGAIEHVRWDYPRIDVESPDLLLVTHEHMDHNGVEAIDDPAQTVRSLAGTFETPVGEVLGVAAEHDTVAGSARGATSMFVLMLEGLRIAHLGDLGQDRLRAEQVEAIGTPDILMVPVGGMATIDGERAAGIVEQLAPTWIVPMHYRTPAIEILEPADSFLERFSRVEKLPASSFDTTDLPTAVDGPVVIVPAVPTA
jgi:L-ascorbate metabolism protein UlaG (beta-lactamase superfamily)